VRRIIRAYLAVAQRLEELLEHLLRAKGLDLSAPHLQLHLGVLFFHPTDICLQQVG
jgi:hypothetical protein